MTNYNSTIAAMSLAQLLQTEPEDSLYHLIAQTIVKCLGEGRNISTNYLSRICNVSKTSITRFCRYLGFDSFISFKESIQMTESDLHSKYPSETNTPTDFANSYLNQIIQNCLRMKETFNASELFHLAEEIRSHENICLLGNGQSGNSLNSFMISLLLQGKYAQVSSMPSQQKKIINNLKPDTIVIILSVYGSFFDMYVTADCFLNKPENTDIYLLTCNQDLPSPPGIDHVILCCNDTGFSGGNLSTDIVLNLVLQYYRILCINQQFNHND